MIQVMMWKLCLLFSVSLVAASGYGDEPPLDCESNLRLLYPEWFAHCDCSYSDWSKWQFVEGSIVAVPVSQCASGQAYSESRTRSAFGDGCLAETETRVICMPDVVDRLIEALGLGSSDNDIIAADSAATFSLTDSNKLSLDLTADGNVNATYFSRQQTLESLCPGTGNNGFICTGQPYNTGKRSLGREFQPTRRSPKKRSEPVMLPIDPTPYNRHEHGARFRRQSNTECQPNGEQFVLFLLDTSGSIGPSNFRKMKEAVRNITALFCKPIRVAVMTFSDTFYLEFCFNCFGTDLPGRRGAKAAIDALSYRSGLTYTGGAAKCACDKLLTPECGMHPDANCIDIVFITDGKSNDPSLEVCEEVKCLHNQYTSGVNTHAIGINGANQPELECIERASNTSSAFNFDSFEDFVGAIREIISRMKKRGSDYKCYTLPSG